MGNSFGTLFRISTWGESHGGGIGVVVDGCPPRLPLSVEDIQFELDRRRPGQSDITTPRKESDTASIVSGVYEGQTLGTPIGIYVPNGDQRPSAYTEMKDKFRPSHADYTYQTKFGIRNHEGGGRSSARETIGRVAAGAIAKKILKLAGGIELRAYITRVHDIEAQISDFPSLEAVEANPVRCPDPEAAEKMAERIREVRANGDSVGGLIECRIRNLPVGLGVPVFDRLEADLAKAMLSLPATKGFEFGSGFEGSLLKGSEHNDVFINKNGTVGTATNRSGGVQGGISNGEEVVFRVAFKPTATLIQNQATVDKDGNETELMGRGRHDPCVVPRAVPIVESMAALVVVDHWMRHKAQCESFDF
ncbi:chorismate synthase [Coraliomargarita akajimensis]|uniref:Chorismate synthase n=1 Tax=Coraliomargarita akajimensis (strain DSM 45221 / IAM 15411 / JCM 23193 / KCTC 12865 / 04OKA010-24) TaxID=583355 RepID=D5EPN3_CORAD|nr:chorismate synthase [Coraliomargarita akajimensis]ADE53770.1 chorismate synthase [Coraliomargarita akajimensis DSM 45221]